MNRVYRRTAALLCTGALTATAFAAPAAASASEPAASGLSGTIDSAVAGTVSGTVLSDTAEEVVGSWTAERMREAVPMDQLITEDRKRVSLGEVVDTVTGGEPVSIPSTPRLKLDDLLPGLDGLLGLFRTASGEPWPGGGEVADTAGRVFFTFDGQDASCSGNAVTSENGSTVMTAGHCVKMDGSWHEDWVFVPGYHDGQAPHGEWPAEVTMATQQWVDNEDINYDVGAAVVHEQDGQRLTDVVGGQGIAFNQERGQHMDAFGYPAAPPYDGSELIRCSGDTFNDPLFSTAIGMRCDMTGGSSGGPWFLGFDEQAGTGVQNSVNSFGYIFLPGVMFGPYFGDAAQEVYERASVS
ncbi:peptidase [Haloechinothrix sp. LS1_15]|uniref:trypsin-like serine peptidase n=1 Tax=Haloechinothrix sp. LS1_15 TaxID=2652248 RepID=UPI0029458EAD|nr:peptidase [Haloechinothrix sp. LS1_15]MDV6012665.1 peptidase [Haloechinothrix sp. LS1_15]